MKYLIYIQEMIENFIASLSKQALFVKHYDNEEVGKADFLGLMPKQLPAVCYYHEYHPDLTCDAYEPFFKWIRLSYINFYQETMTPEEFLENCNVYSLHIEPFATYIRDGQCHRTEDIMSVEVNFERKNIFSDIIQIFHYISNQHPLVLIISDFHLAPLSSVQMILKLLKEELPNLHFIVIYNDTFYIRSYISEAWNQLISYVQDRNMLVEWGRFSSDISMNSIEDFIFEPKDFSKNLKNLWNMYHSLALEDAWYYISDIYNKIEHNRSILTEQQACEVLILYTLLNLAMDNTEEAVMSCKTISELKIYHQDSLVAYYFHYLSIKTQFSNSPMDSIRNSYQTCVKIAKELQDDFLLFKAELLYVMAQFGGWKDLFLCDFRIPVPTELLDSTERYGFRNHLAYLYAMGFENDIESVTAIATGKENSYYFSKGIALARELGNNDFLMSAYMKNIIIYSDAGFHEYVYKMHKKRIETVSSNDVILQAHMYLGIGYNCIILENYEKADQYFRIALRNLVIAKKADDCMDALYNICMNYFVIEDYETVIPCVEVLLKMLSYLGYQNLMVCNTAKLYAMLSISHFQLQDYYKSYHYLGQMDIYMTQLIGDNEDADYKYWEEELFLYHYLKAILYEYEDNIEGCKKELDISYHFLWLLPGTIFYTYYLYTVAMSNLYLKLEEYDKRREIILKAVDYYKKQGFMQCAGKLTALLNQEDIPKTILQFNKHELYFEQLLSIANFEGTQNKLKQREKDISFLTIWQENLNRSESNVDALINQAISIMQNTYSLGGVILLKKEASKYSVIFKNSDINISANQIHKIFDFFQTYKRGFLTSRTDKNFFQFMPVIQPFQKNKIVSMLGIPISDGSTNYVLLSHVNSQRNFTGNRTLLTNENLVTLKFACNQLMDVIKRIMDNNLIRRMNEKLEKVSMTDYLTGIYNRHGFSYIIKNKLNYEKGSTNLILYIDLDNFKYYNDTFGHDTGDFVLIRFSQLFQELVGDKGYTIRYGGDEFLIVIPNQSESYGLTIADKIYSHIGDGFRKSLEEYLHTEIVIPEDKKLSCSIGIAEYSGNTQKDIDQALNNADQALYFIKRNSKGRSMTWSKLKDFKL